MAQGNVTRKTVRKIDQAIEDHLLVRPGKRVRLADRGTSWTGAGEISRLGTDEFKERAHEFLRQNLEELAEAQSLLWANDTRSLLVVFQAMDAAGKDGTIRHVMSGVNPTGCRVASFKTPTAHELDHNWLWRVWHAVPQRGEICIFNRSHYEDVLVTRVHPELLEASRMPDGRRGKAFWRQRYEDINAFEKHLAANGTTVVKMFLHVSRQEQKRRFLERLDHPGKNWKFSMGDLAERKHWDAYMEAYEKALSATATPWAPWYVVPADNKWIMRVAVARIITRTIAGLGLTTPKLDDEQRRQLAAARLELESE